VEDANRSAGHSQSISRLCTRTDGIKATRGTSPIRFVIHFRETGKLEGSLWGLIGRGYKKKKRMSDTMERVGSNTHEIEGNIWKKKPRLPEVQKGRQSGTFEVIEGKEYRGNNKTYFTRRSN